MIRSRLFRSSAKSGSRHSTANLRRRFEPLEQRQLLAVSASGLPPVLSGPVDITSVATVGDTLYFVGATPETGAELWKSDGTIQGTVLVKDINAGSVGSHPLSMTNVDGILYFSANDGIDGRELWKSDGTAEGTVRVRDILPGAGGSQAYKLANVNGTLFFLADNGTTGTELWKSDGTEAGTQFVKDIRPGPLSALGGIGSLIPTMLANVGSQLYFTADVDGAGPELWTSDGTAAGTHLVKDLRADAGSFPNQLTAVGETLFFIAYTPDHGHEVWKTDGTESGTLLVKDVFPGSENSWAGSLTNVNGTLFFTADDGANGSALWKSDGTSSGTQLLLANPGTTGFTPLLRNFTAIGDTLYFAAGIGSFQMELWKSDGTAEGTLQVRDINPGSLGSDPMYLTNVGGALYFRANDGTHGPELWKSDGTNDGTALVADLRPGPQGALGSFFTRLVSLNDTLYFVTSDAPRGAELWTTDGTEEGTSRIFPLFLAPLFADDVVELNGTYYFAADDGQSGVELWSSDGTVAGTSLVVDLAAEGSSTPKNLKVEGGLLYFEAFDTQLNSFVAYRSNGTSDGTRRAYLPGELPPDTVGLFQPAPKIFWLRAENEPGPADSSSPFFADPFDGPEGWYPLAGDWDDLGYDTPAVYRGGQFMIKDPQSKWHDANIQWIQFGPEDNPNIIPLAGDWDGDGTTTIGIYDSQTSTFYLKNSLTPGVADVTFVFGAGGQGLIPIVGDWDGNGTDTVAIYSGQAFFVANQNAAGAAETVFGFGPTNSGWKPIAGDWDGDNIDTVGLYNGETFFLRNMFLPGPADTIVSFGPLNADWLPVVGDWQIPEPDAEPVPFAESTSQSQGSSHQFSPAIRGFNNHDRKQVLLISAPGSTANDLLSFNADLDYANDAPDDNSDAIDVLDEFFAGELWL